MHPFRKGFSKFKPQEGEIGDEFCMKYRINCVGENNELRISVLYYLCQIAGIFRFIKASLYPGKI